MEKLTFDIFKLDDSMCIIHARNVRTDIRKLANGGCICDMETLLDEMERIKDEALGMGYEVVFTLQHNKLAK